MQFAFITRTILQETHQELRHPNVTLLYFATPFAFNAPDGGFPWDDFRKILRGGQKMAKVQNSEEILPKLSTPLSRAHERYRRQTDRRIYDSKDTNVT